MIRSALLLCAGLLIAACFACMPATTPSPYMPAAAPPASCAFNNITMVAASFDPTNASGTPVPAGSIPAYVQQNLTDAYNLAPPFFQQQLCALDGVFIAPSGDSWAFRNITNGKKYLALSMTLWNGGSAPAFSAYESTVVHRLLRGWTTPNHTSKGNDPSDAPAVTVLAALAHEYGHILFYTTFVKPYYNPPDFTAFCGGGFYSASWQSLPGGANLWRSYGDVVGSHAAGDVQIQDILNAVPKPGFPDTRGAGGLLDKIYNPAIGHWASLFAAFSPDEDFVETFKLFVLKNSKAPLGTLPIEIPIANVIVTEDIPGTCSKRPVLAAKLSCFAQAMCGASPGTDACSPIASCQAGR
jgi:hypothetical protein